MKWSEINISYASNPGNKGNLFSFRLMKKMQCKPHGQIVVYMELLFQYEYNFQKLKGKIPLGIFVMRGDGHRGKFGSDGS